MEVTTRFATTIANPLGARQESAPMASIDNIVTAVRMFSETLLHNRVSKEVQQEVKALAAHMEILITRRRLAANKSRSPTVAETRVALRNLKRFLEREAHKEKAKKKPSASCTTDTLESSSTLAQAFSPGCRRSLGLRSLSAYDDPVARAAVCGSRGDTDCRRQEPTATQTAENLRIRCCVEPAGPELPHHRDRQAVKSSRRERKRPTTPPPPSPPQPLPLRSPAQLVRLTCSEGLPLLLLPYQQADNSAKEDAATAHDVGVDSSCCVHAVTEWAPPMEPAESASSEARARQLAPAAPTPDPLLACARCQLFRCRSQPRTERAPFVAANHQLEEAARRPMAVAAESTFELPVLVAEASCDRGDRGRKSCCCYRGAKAGGRGGFFGGGEVDCKIGNAAVAEQGNFNCASISCHVAVVSWAKATFVADGDSRQPKAPEAPRRQGSSNQLVSTCSCPSDSDNRKASEATNAAEEGSDEKKGTEESVDLQTSSAQVQGVEPTRHGHVSIDAAPIWLVQRVCESCSPEVLVSSTSVQTVGEDTGNWHQPVVRSVDLFGLVRMAAHLARSASPTEALEVAVSRGAVGNAADAVAAAVDGNSDSGRSKSTLEVVDQSGTTAEAEVPAAAAAATAAAAVSSPTPDPGALGRTWSSYEVGQSSGFTKLLLTLDKAAKRRREQARTKQRPRQPKQQRPTAAAAAGSPPDAGGFVARGRRTPRSGNNSGSQRQRQRQRRPPPPPSPAPTQQPPPLQPPPPQPSLPVDAIMRRQEQALKLAAQSLGVLARSLQLCVRRVHDAAEAINCSLT